MCVVSYFCDDGYIVLNIFVILDVIIVKNGCIFFYVKKSEKGGIFDI